MTVDKNEEALTAIDAAIEGVLNTPEIWNNRGKILQALQRPDEALESFAQCLEIQPEYAPAYFGRGRIEWNQDNFEEARASFQKFLEFAGVPFGSDSGFGIQP